jgi:hypothetical protein
METNLTPLFANLSLAFFELDASRSLHITIPNIAHYLDDILGNTNTKSDTQLQSTIAIIYQPTQLITKSEKFCNYTVYLDIQLPSPQSETILEFVLFCKPGTNFQYPLFNSFIPRHIPTGLVISGFIHIYNYNSHWNNFLVVWNGYVNILWGHGYPKT